MLQDLTRTNMMVSLQTDSTTVMLVGSDTMTRLMLPLH